MYMYMYMYMYVYMYVYIFIYIHTNIYIHTYRHIYICKCKCICKCICICICIYIYIDIHTHIYIYISFVGLWKIGCPKIPWWIIIQIVGWGYTSFSDKPYGHAWHKCATAANEACLWWFWAGPLPVCCAACSWILLCQRRWGEIMAFIAGLRSKKLAAAAEVL